MGVGKGGLAGARRGTPGHAWARLGRHAGARRGTPGHSLEKGGFRT